MRTTYQATGANAQAPFSLKIHRGDGMALLAMDWRQGKPPRNFVGFSIEFREPGSDQFWPVKNRIGFPGQRTKSTDPAIESTKAPFQKFRWVHFPWNANKAGEFTYRVTPMFMDTTGVLGRGEAQTASIALMRETLRGKINVAFTRGYVSSQAFAQNFAPDGDLTTLVPPFKEEGLEFKATHERADEALAWMGFEARKVIHEVLDEAISSSAQVRVIAYDLNLPEILTRLEALGPRLRIIIDDSDDHGDPTSPESKAAARLKRTAGNANVVRQHMANLQHHKSIGISGDGIHKVVYGSTNFTWRGLFVQSNNAVVVTGKKAADRYFDTFETYFGAGRVEAFRTSSSAAGWHELGVPGVDARVGFSPHAASNGLLGEVGKDIGNAKSSVFFSLAFLGQMTKGPIGPALGKQIRSKKVFTLGIADARVKAGNLGVTVMTPDDQRLVVRASALTGNVPAPFRTEPSGLSGPDGNGRGTRMHHKFVVLDFDTDDARVYLGSYNFSEPADRDNGENLVLIKDRTVATSYMIEAVRIYDHYRFRTRQEGVKKAAAKGSKKPKVVELKLPPQKPSEKPWWQWYWDDPISKRDRKLFA